MGDTLKEKDDDLSSDITVHVPMKKPIAIVVK
jgi:hypothetical protein